MKSLLRTMIFLVAPAITTAAVAYFWFVSTVADETSEARSGGATESPPYGTIIAVVNGLSGQDLILQVNDAGEVGIRENGESTVGTFTAGEKSYKVAISRQPSPPPQVCTVENGNGSIQDERKIEVFVHCTPWTKQGGAGEFSSTAITAMATDREGHLYVAGDTNGSVVGFKDGKTDAFLMKYDVRGQAVYVKQWGISSVEMKVADVVIDGEDNVHVVSVAENADRTFSRLYIVKYDRFGNQVYSSEYGEEGVRTSGESADTDSDGNLYLVQMEDSLRSVDRKTRGRLSYLVKLDPLGRVVFQKSVSDEFEDRVTLYSVKVDHKGDILVLGVEVDLKSKVETHFINKYDSSGSRLLSKIIGHGGKYGGMALTELMVDPQDNVLVVGGFYGEGAEGQRDILTLKYDAGLNRVYRRRLGSKRNLALVYDAATDSMGNLFVVGETTEGIDGQEKVGSIDAFLLKYGPKGQKVYTKQFGARGATGAYAVALDVKNNVFVAGDTWGELDGHTSSGTIDYFIMKYGHDGTKL